MKILKYFVVLFIICFSSEVFGQTKPDSIVCFIGELVSVECVKPNYSMLSKTENKFLKYRVVESFSNATIGDTFTISFSESGRLPRIQEYTYFLIFSYSLDRPSNNLYLGSDQFNPLILDSSGIFLSPYLTFYQHPEYETPILPGKKPLSKPFRLDVGHWDEEWVKYYFENGYYNIKEGYVYTSKTVLPHDLFEYKRIQYMDIRRNSISLLNTHINQFGNSNIKNIAYILDSTEVSKQFIDNTNPAEISSVTAVGDPGILEQYGVSPCGYVLFVTSKYFKKSSQRKQRSKKKRKN